MFGTLKRQRGFTFTLVRGKANVLEEVGLMFIGYNLSRCISILGAGKLIKALKECCLLVLMGEIRPLLRRFNQYFIQAVKTGSIIMRDFDAPKSSLFNSKKLYLYVIEFLLRLPLCAIKTPI